MKQHINQEQDLHETEIRQLSRECLIYFQKYGEITVQGRLMTSRYAGSLISLISADGGNIHGNILEIHTTLSMISKFFSNLLKDRNKEIIIPRHSIPRHPDLIKQFNEQIEEEQEPINHSTVFMGYTYEMDQILEKYKLSDVTKNQPLRMISFHHELTRPTTTPYVQTWCSDLRVV
ncbi:MAG: hypothetical protein EZS28_045613, partial [Streblomastix strix]